MVDSVKTPVFTCDSIIYKKRKKRGRILQSLNSMRIDSAEQIQGSTNNPPATPNTMSAAISLSSLSYVESMTTSDSAETVHSSPPLPMPSKANTISPNLEQAYALFGQFKVPLPVQKTNLKEEDSIKNLSQRQR